MKKKMILSVDTGIDDALAIAYAIGQQEMELIGITVSYGMSIVENTYRNTKKLVELLGAQVPVYMGSAVPIVRPGRDYKLAGRKIMSRRMWPAQWWRSRWITSLTASIPTAKIWCW